MHLYTNELRPLKMVGECSGTRSESRVVRFGYPFAPKVGIRCVTEFARGDDQVRVGINADQAKIEEYVYV